MGHPLMMPCSFGSLSISVLPRLAFYFVMKYLSPPIRAVALNLQRRGPPKNSNKKKKKKNPLHKLHKSKYNPKPTKFIYQTNCITVNVNKNIVKHNKRVSGSTMWLLQTLRRRQRHQVRVLLLAPKLLQEDDRQPGM